MKRGQHALDLRAPLGRALYGQSRGQARPHHAFGLIHPPPLIESHVQPVHPTEPPERPLGHRNIHQDEVPIEDTRRPLVCQESPNRERSHPVADGQLDGLSHVEPGATRECLAEDDRIGRDEQGQQILRRRIAAAPGQTVVADGPVSEDVDAEHPHGLTPVVPQTCDGLTLHHRADGSELAQPDQVAHAILVDANARPGDFERRPAGDGVDRRREPLNRAGVRQTDRDDHRHAQRDAGRRHQRAQRLLRETPDDEQAEEREHGLPALGGRHATVPHGDDAVGRRRHLAVVRGEDDGEPVTPMQLGKDAEDARAVLRVEVAGGLVGYQERRMMDDGAGNGGPLHLPGGELRRAVPDAEIEPDACREIARHPVRLACRAAGEHERQRDVLGDGEGR